MNPDHPADPSNPNSIDAMAAAWVLKRDRGLSPDEQDAYLQWLAANQCHAAAVARQEHAWDVFDRLAGLQASIQAIPDPDLLAPAKSTSRRRNRRGRYYWALLPFAAAVLIGTYWLTQEFPGDSGTAVAELRLPTSNIAPIEERKLQDGTMLRLNRGAIVTVEYSSRQRLVRLEHGEAAFEVAKDIARPFIVQSFGIAVRAVGTAFNVRLEQDVVDVIVTEGEVAVAGASLTAATPLPVVRSGQRALISTEPSAGPPGISTLSTEELARRLAWQPRMLTFTNESLVMILNEFNRHNSVSIRIDDPILQDLKLAARFRSDNIHGFLRLLEGNFYVRAHFQSNGEIVLRSAR